MQSFSRAVYQKTIRAVIVSDAGIRFLRLREVYQT